MGDKTRDKEELAKLLEEKEFNIRQAMEICAEQERAVKEGDAESVRAGYEVLIVKYEELVAFLQSVLEPLAKETK